MTRCGQEGCNNRAAYRYTWPGKDEDGICEDHVEQVRAAAAAMSFHLQILPLPSPDAANCKRCGGCGLIADTDEGEPWTAWSELPPGADLAVRIGAVSPVPCPACSS